MFKAVLPNALAPNTIDIIKDKITGSLIGFYIGDALAMPVHWYYDRSQLKRDFGAIAKYEAPKAEFVGSIMNLSNTGGGGRGGDKGDVVGSIILHGITLKKLNKIL
jgi:ADP-ribosyl-[dinitrogen reductase] hydrolase